MNVDEMKYMRKSDKGLLKKVPMLFFGSRVMKTKKMRHNICRERANYFRFFGKTSMDTIWLSPCCVLLCVSEKPIFYTHQKPKFL